MLLKLSLLLSTIGIIACNVPFDTTKEVKYEETNQIHQRNYQHSEYLNSYTEVVYKYETNEVNDYDDFVVGHTYQFVPSVEANEFGDFLSLGFDISNIIILNDDEVSSLNFDYYSFSNIDFLSCTISNEASTIVTIDFDGIDDVGGSSNIYFNRYQHDFNFVILLTCSYKSESSGELSGLNLITDLSNDYNEIETVIYHQPQTIVGVINEFCETYLFSEIPYINTMTFEVGGQSINLMTYLIIIVGIVLAIGLLIFFFWFLKFIFGLFAGVFRMRR